MIFKGEIWIRCKRCGYPIHIGSVLGYFPNIGDSITVKCSNCGKEH